ncbi:LysR substrate-binding domain-containing protein [Piscinibacter sakaiensis]|uniref:Transcriptional regulator n=1 Tax=Piscinibacter sakaiensis TaxID=1547922 RepID=A0A0K8NZH0_PISS1|nr:LysR substrate-binding domain-containing protein [Piscinibacter sakaiensis]GAP35674.1 transcriptional regulator [Piscinibacter sakaiensis]
MHFDFADLRLFLHLVECGNLTRGASAAALSPAAASGRLKALEEQLGARLFYRSSRGLAPTPAGELFLRHARGLLRQLEHVRNDFGELSSESAGHFRIFANTTPITETLPRVLGAFLQRRPGVTVDVQERNTRQVIEAVNESAADVGVISVPSPYDPGPLQSLCYATDRLVLVVPEGHALAAAGRLDFEETLDLPHVGYANSTLQTYIVGQAAALQRQLVMRVLMSSYETMCAMIAAGIGVGVLPRSCAARYVRSGMRMAIVELRDAWTLRERHVLYRDLEALPMCARDFIDAVGAIAEGPSGSPPR